MKTTVVYSKKFPARGQFPLETVVLYDPVLTRNKAFKNWLSTFAYKLALKAGEELKTLRSFEKTLEKLNSLRIPQTANLTFVAVGGGSVGDFTGFLASTFLRGRPFVQIPSTWLAAVDSAHGGKNGLNFQNTKNQIGTIFPSERTYIVEELLQSQPHERLSDALGEVAKMSLICSRPIFETLERREADFSSKDLIQLLPRLIDLKMKIVAKDPFEKKGDRRVLNLGHTLGHVIEAQLKISHGQAVKLGILFSARWSFRRGLLKENDFIRISNLLHHLPGEANLHSVLPRLQKNKAEYLLTKDKKITSSDTLDFIFLRGIGSVERAKVRVREIVQELETQKLEY